MANIHNEGLDGSWLRWLPSCVSVDCFHGKHPQRRNRANSGTSNITN
jgi:hypothetical protein